MNSVQRFHPILQAVSSLILVCFAVQKPFNLMQSHLSILALISWAIGILFKK
jgi:hypothetical protein